MPPKSSNKKNQATWFRCETCGVHITTKARDTHDQVCPITEETNNAEYISNGVLYTESLLQRNFEVEALKDLPAKYGNTLIFLSEGAIQFAELHIGQKVVIAQAKQTEDMPAPLVRTIWPVSEQFLTTVFVPAEGMFHFPVLRSITNLLSFYHQTTM